MLAMVYKEFKIFKKLSDALVLFTILGITSAVFFNDHPLYIAGLTLLLILCIIITSIMPFNNRLEEVFIQKGKVVKLIQLTKSQYKRVFIVRRLLIFWKVQVATNFESRNEKELKKHLEKLDAKANK